MGKSNSEQHTNQSAQNSQTTISGTGNVAVGSGAISGNANTINITSADADAVALAQHAVDSNAITNTTALEGITTTANNALGLANNALTDNSLLVGTAIAGNNALTNSTLAAYEHSQDSAFNALAGIVNTASLGFQADSQNALAIAANAAPQTDAAQNEILAGTAPIAAGSVASDNAVKLEHYLTIASLAIGAFLLIKNWRKA